MLGSQSTEAIRSLVGACSNSGSMIASPTAIDTPDTSDTGTCASRSIVFAPRMLRCVRNVFL